jgi:N-methylhydantoinase A
MKKPTLEKIARGTAKPRKEALTGMRKVYFEGKGWAQAAVYQRDALLAGNLITGPALIEEHATTTVLQPGDSLKVEPYGNLQIAIAKK